MRIATVPSPRLTGNKISEAEWKLFISTQKERGHGWAIADFDQFKHLIPKPAPLTDADKTKNSDGDDANVNVTVKTEETGDMELDSKKDEDEQK